MRSRDLILLDSANLAYIVGGKAKVGAGWVGGLLGHVRLLIKVRNGESTLEGCCLAALFERNLFAFCEF